LEQKKERHHALMNRISTLPTRQQRAEDIAQRVNSCGGYLQWAATYDLPFYLHFAVRDLEAYFGATKPFTPVGGGEFGTPPTLENVSEAYWRGDLATRNCFGTSHREEIAAWYTRWVNSGRPVRNQSDDSELWMRIEEHMDLDPKGFWEFRAEWGDDVSSTCGFLDAYDGGRGIK